MKKIVYIFFLIILVSCDFIFKPFSYEKGFSRLKKNIERKLEGKITNVFAPRDNMNYTHFVLNKNDTIIPTNSKIMDYIKVGDFVIKKSFENEILIMKNDSIFKIFWLYKIPKEYREDNRFPKEWKNKWLRSTVD